MTKRTLEYHGVTSGKKQPSLYQVWSQIKQRCFNKNCPKYKNYGARGIDMDPRWVNSFTTFQRETEGVLGPRPSKKHSLGRIDNNKGYWPGNVRWETSRQQMRNTRSNRLVKVKGKKAQPLIQVAEAHGMAKRRLRERLESGLSADEALSRPIERGTLYITWKRKTHNLAVWAKKFKVPYWTLHQWIQRDKKPVGEVFGKLARKEWPGKGKPRREPYKKP